MGGRPLLPLMMLDESMAVVASGGAVPQGRGQHGDQFREMRPTPPPSTTAAASSMARDHAATSQQQQKQQHHHQQQQQRHFKQATEAAAWRALSLAGVALGLVGTILGAVALVVASHHD
jgi:hypothetical protein